MSIVNLRGILLFVGVTLSVAAALRLMPQSLESVGAERIRRWDIPVRMLTVTIVVVGLTGAATALGPRLSGILATFPIYAATLATFGHHSAGWQAAVQVLRGLLYGLFGFAVFFVVLAISLTHASIPFAFLTAAITGFAVQGSSLWAIRRDMLISSS